MRLVVAQCNGDSGVTRDRDSLLRVGRCVQEVVLFPAVGLSGAGMRRGDEERPRAIARDAAGVNLRTLERDGAEGFYGIVPDRKQFAEIHTPSIA